MAWNDFVVGERFEWFFSFSENDQLLFSKLSGDANPIHFDKKFAVSKGFEGPIVFGILLTTQLSRLIGQELADSNSILTSIKVDFINPCYQNEQLLFKALLHSKSASTNYLIFKFKIFCRNMVISTGTCEALWKVST